MNINTKITFSFDNKNPSKITGEFLLVRIQNTDHKSNLAKLFDRSTKSLKVKEANSLLRSILSAIIINDGLDDNEVNLEDVDFSDSEEIQEEDEKITEQNTKPLMLSATQAPKQSTTYQPITLLFSNKV